MTRAHGFFLKSILSGIFIVFVTQSVQAQYYPPNYYYHPYASHYYYYNYPYYSPQYYVPTPLQPFPKYRPQKNAVLYVGPTKTTPKPIKKTIPAQASTSNYQGSVSVVPDFRQSIHAVPTDMESGAQPSLSPQIHQPQPTGYQPHPRVPYIPPPKFLPTWWVQGEVLFWFVDDAPLIPLVTTDVTNDPFEGSLGQPGTRILFGDSDGEYDLGIGGRLTLGKWLSESVATELTGFFLPQQSVSFSEASDNTGNPPLFFPFFRAELNREGSFSIADPTPQLGPGPIVGSVNIDSELSLWGAEWNIFRKVSCEPGSIVCLITGIRYAGMNEALRIQSSIRDVPFDLNVDLQDSFETSNHFVGGQIGGLASFRYKRFTADLIGKVALGANLYSANISGSNTQTGTGAINPGTSPGGIYTQPTNIGSRNRGVFTVIPQFQFRVAMDVTPTFRIFAGYDFLYWSEVVRPGDQIDRTINATQTLGRPLVGEPRPQVIDAMTDFYVHGLSAGFQWDF